MHIHRFDIRSGGNTPRSAAPPGLNTQREPALNASKGTEAEGVAGGRELDQLSRQLDGISEVRPDVVAAARVKVQGGDYLTRAAAEQTAAAILSKDA